MYVCIFVLPISRVYHDIEVFIFSYFVEKLVIIKLQCLVGKLVIVKIKSFFCKEVCWQNLSKIHTIMETREEIFGRGVDQIIKQNLYKSLVYLSLSFLSYLYNSASFSCLLYKRVLKSNFVKDFYL